MSDTESTEQKAKEGETPTETTPAPASDSKTGFDTTAVKAETVDNLPEYGQKIIKDLRKENADHRTTLDTKVAKAVEDANAESLKKYNELSTQYEAALKAKSTAELEYAKLETALTAGVEPTKAKAFAARLRGETPEELLADAKELTEVFGSQTQEPRRGDPSQGRASGAPQPTGLAALIHDAQNKR